MTKEWNMKQPLKGCIWFQTISKTVEKQKKACLPFRYPSVQQMKSIEIKFKTVEDRVSTSKTGSKIKFF